MATFGKQLKLSIFGGAHDEEIGMTLVGFPAGEPVDEAALAAFLARRAPGRSPLATARFESDIPVFTSGIAEGKTTGDVIRAVIRNGDVRSEAYATVNDVPRPAHADLAAILKYGNDVDLRGGGRFSGRLTAPLCVAGGLCLSYLAARGVTVTAHIAEIGGIADTCPDTPENTPVPDDFPVYDPAAGERMKAAILAAKAEGDSLGGVVECRIAGLPAGLGEHPFDDVESRLSALLFSVPAVKGVDFGAGFSAARMRGSEHNDAIRIRDGVVYTETNRAGGILGGMTNGMPVTFRAAFKPTPSIAKEQKSVSLSRGENVTMRVSGRHDPCVVPRAVPCVIAAAAIVAADLMLEREARTLAELRREIDRVDADLVSLFAERMALSREIGALKRQNGGAVRDPARENALLARVAEAAGAENAGDVKKLYEMILSLSRARQHRDKRVLLIGERLSHSYSPAVHAMLGSYSYDLIELAPEELPAFLARSDYDALNVTIPYKQSVIPYLDELSETAARIGVANTVIRRADGKKIGYNTDYDGFLDLADEAQISFAGKKVLVLGSGGASRTVCAAVTDRGARETVVISRTGKDNYDNLEKHADAEILVNATPVGMYPQTDAVPLDLSRLPRLVAVIDLIYNPARTRLMQAAAARGIRCCGGLTMLVSQARRAAELFLGEEISAVKVREITKKIADGMRNVLLIGMPGCGKTTLGARLAEVLGRPFVDTDAEIVREAGKDVSTLFREEGEAGFRRRESAVLARVCREQGQVIATGGGVVAFTERMGTVRENSLVIYLERDMEKLASAGRPLTLAKGAAALAKKRVPLYRAWCDRVVRVDDDPEITLARIREAIR